MSDFILGISITLSVVAASAVAGVMVALYHQRRELDERLADIDNWRHDKPAIQEVEMPGVEPGLYLPKRDPVTGRVTLVKEDEMQAQLDKLFPQLREAENDILDTLKAG